MAGSYRDQAFGSAVEQPLSSVLFVRAPNGGIIRHFQPFLGHNKPMVLVHYCAAPFGLPPAVFRSAPKFLHLGHWGFSYSLPSTSSLPQANGSALLHQPFKPG